jgi:patatin-like phospholipase
VIAAADAPDTTNGDRVRAAALRDALHKTGSAVAYLYLLRVPLITCGFLVALPILGLPRDAPAGPLVRGLFDIADPEASRFGVFLPFALVTLNALFVAAAVAITARLILLDGHARFNVDAIGRPAGIQLIVRLVPLICAVVFVGGAWTQSWPNITSVPAAALGTFVAVALFTFLLTIVHDRLWDDVFVKDQSFLTTNNAIVGIADSMFRLFTRVVRLTPSGFVDPQGRIWARHAFALLQFLLSVLLYGTLFLFKLNWPFVAAGPPRIPTLCLLLVLAMLACWALSGLTFLFDRHRVPLLSLLVAYGTIMSVVPWNDHFFPTLPYAGTPAPTPTAAAVLRPRANKPAIVIAAEGGGIQAAAWTARVIRELQRDSENCGDGFDQALVAISSVSGGSAGAMFIVDAYRDGRMRDRQVLDNAVKAAEASSLDEVAWGLTYPDLVWSVFPFFKGVYRPFLVKDRGTALEDAWKRTPSLATATLDEWRRHLGEQPLRRRPAVMFNATVAETGQRVVFGTTTLETEADDRGRREFAIDFRDVDVSVVTAARMSSTFPYVSPAARVSRRAGFDDQYHYVDGGYYDNYGTATLLEWLDGGLIELGGEIPSRILIIEIRSFPNETAAHPTGRRGWIADTIQPLTTLYAVRGAGQEAHSNFNTHLIRDDYDRLIDDVQVTFPANMFPDRPDDSPPLSWHLTPEDRGRLAAAWQNADVASARVKIHTFMRLDDAAIGTSCLGF